MVLQGIPVTGERSAAGGLCMLLGILLALCMLTPAWAANVTFRFNPPDGLSFVDTVVSTQTRTSSLSKEKQVRKDTVKRRITIHKTATGYTINFTSLALSSELNGKKVGEVNQSQLKEMALVYVLDKNGKLLDARGLERMVSRMQNNLPPERKKTFDAKKVRADMLKQFQSDWQKQLSAFNGKTVAIGTSQARTDSVLLDPGVLVPVQVKLKFAALTRINGHDCVKIVETSQPDPRKLTTDLNAAIDHSPMAKNSKQDELPKVLSVQYATTRERVINPSVLLSYDEKMSTSDVTVMQVPGKGKVTITRIDHMDCTCRF